MPLDVKDAIMPTRPNNRGLRKTLPRRRREMLSAARCGCFYCCETFEPAEITEWIDPTADDPQSGETALCPRCGIDSVIPLREGMDRSHLEQMRKRSF